MLENYYDSEFELRFFEMDKWGEASATTILTLLEETAANHCLSIDHSLYYLIEKQVGWVLRAGAMEMYRYPRYKEKITIRTWLSSYSAIRGIRENIIYDEQQNIIGRAKGLWVFFDVAKRRPTQIFDAIMQRWMFCSKVCLDTDINTKIEPLHAATYCREFEVKRYDIDMNQHVNNIRYLQWVIESLPNDIFEHYSLESIDGRFVAEAHFGDTLISFTEENGRPDAFIHTVKVKGTDKVCATATTTWKKRV
ncbi:MAG: acyl-ACP thioesterase [Bacteroidetes bacterium B1(2017)]|nr:MAG: acyl-ACP thioesterase [Bacteroidetes bacterium B1(2017)]